MSVSVPAMAPPVFYARAPTLVKLTPMLAYFALQAFLAIGMKLSSSFATLHALLTGVVGLSLVLFSRRPITAVFVAAYIVGAEILWRMSRAGVFWEYSKYLMVLVLITSMLRTGRLHFPPLPTLYLLALVPSTILTLMEYDWYYSRRLVSGDLSGPLLLAVCGFFFTKLKLTPEDRTRVLITAIGPILGVAALALYSTLTAGTINFTGNSNYTTSGKYGPNQVSATLSLGAILAFLCLVQTPQRKRRLLFFGLMCYLMGQSVLTFSRTGLYIGTLSCLAASFYLLRVQRARALLLKVFAVVIVIAAVVVVPMLDSLTQGAFTDRFKSAQSTSRDKIAAADLKIWLENPVLGVGTGQALFHRGKYLELGTAAAHTEFSRLLAEHGMLGLFAGVMMFVMAWLNLRRAQGPSNQAVVVAVIAWSFLCMTANGLRLTAPCFTFGLSFALLLPAGFVSRPARKGAAAPSSTDVFRPGGLQTRPALAVTRGCSPAGT